MKTILLVVSLVISTSVYAEDLGSMMKPDSFQNLRIDIDGNIYDQKELQHLWKIANESKTSKLVTSAGIELEEKGAAKSYTDRSIEVFKNSNGKTKALLYQNRVQYDDKMGAAESSVSNYVRFGKDYKVESHTKCWNDADCFTVTESFCQGLAPAMGVSSLQKLYSSLGACQKLTTGIDKAIEGQSEDYWKAHRHNKNQMEESLTASANKSWGQKISKTIEGDDEKSARLKAKDLKKVYDGREMRIYDLVKTCMYYQSSGGFVEEVTPTPQPTSPEDRKAQSKKKTVK